LLQLPYQWGWLCVDMSPKKWPEWYILILSQIIKFWSFVPPRTLILAILSLVLSTPGNAYRL
jgi:hypothetical protein